MPLREFYAAMSPSKNTANEFPETKDAVRERISRIDASNSEITFEYGLASILIHLNHLPRNERGLLLKELIEAGWTIDYIDLDAGTADAFKLKDLS